MKTGGVIYLDVPEEALISRLTGRRVCRSCGAAYHVDAAPPKKEGVCDLCGGDVEQRKDDSIEVIKHRLDVYNEQTKPLMAYYDEMGLLKRVDGQGSSQEVFERVKDILN
jgi:adenylate kinase